MSYNIYVGNLPNIVDDNTLKSMFTSFGTVESAKVIKDRDSGFSKGFGFVEMSTTSEGESAISNLNGSQMDGKDIKVSKAKPKESDNGSRGGNFRERRSYSGGYNSRKSY